MKGSTKWITAALAIAIAGGLWAFSAWGERRPSASEAGDAVPKGAIGAGLTESEARADADTRAKMNEAAAIDAPARATFAGGCFWCMEPPYDELEGVLSTTSGYIGGNVANPTYKQVSSGSTGHFEAVEIAYDPERIGYEKLLEVFWINIDPTDDGGQFCDRGPQYRAAIFYHDEEQRRLAEDSKRDLERSDRLPAPIVTQILPAPEFYPAEEYHQDYYSKNPIRYKLYRAGCGRDRRLQRLWGAEATH